LGWLTRYRDYSGRRTFMMQMATTRAQLGLSGIQPLQR
jgi:hypothetical protein